KQDVEGVLLGRVDQLQRHRRAVELLGVDNSGLADARPFLQDLPEGDVFSDERDPPILHRQLEAARKSGGGEANGQGRQKRAAQEVLFHCVGSPSSIRLLGRSCEHNSRVWPRSTRSARSRQVRRAWSPRGGSLFAVS